MNISFSEKCALVTGAASGIGKEITKRLVQCNAKVIAVDINNELLDILKKEYGVQTITMDISNWEDVNNLDLSKYGNVDLLVNCAGIFFEEEITKITQVKTEKLLDVNVKAIINLTQKVASHILSRQMPGSIVNISSQASMAGLFGQSVYCATKGAVDAFTRVAALELGPHGIRVNSVNPTVIMTELGIKAWSDPEKSEAMRSKIPLGRFGGVDEVADAVVYLLSERASLINGVCLPVDGGFLAT